MNSCLQIINPKNYAWFMINQSNNWVNCFLNYLISIGRIIDTFQIQVRTLKENYQNYLTSKHRLNIIIAGRFSLILFLNQLKIHRNFMKKVFQIILLIRFLMKVYIYAIFRFEPDSISYRRLTSSLCHLEISLFVQAIREN
jgi:hypothetical protein